MRVLLVSTYDLGRQPFGLASAAAALEAAGTSAATVDLSRDPLPEEAVRAADVVAFFLPMHTATRLALPVIDRVRALNPRPRCGPTASTPHSMRRSSENTASRRS